MSTPRLSRHLSANPACNNKYVGYLASSYSYTKEKYNKELNLSTVAAFAAIAFAGGGVALYLNGYTFPAVAGGSFLISFSTVFAGMTGVRAKRPISTSLKLNKSGKKRLAKQMCADIERFTDEQERIRTILEAQNDESSAERLMELNNIFDGMAQLNRRYQLNLTINSFGAFGGGDSSSQLSADYSQIEAIKPVRKDSQTQSGVPGARNGQ